MRVSDANQGGHGSLVSQRSAAPSRHCRQVWRRSGLAAPPKGPRCRLQARRHGRPAGGRASARRSPPARQAAFVALDGDDLGGPFQQQRPREAAGARPDLDRHALRADPCGAGDCARQVQGRTGSYGRAPCAPSGRASPPPRERRQAVRRGPLTDAVEPAAGPGRREPGGIDRAERPQLEAQQDALVGPRPGALGGVPERRGVEDVEDRATRPCSSGELHARQRPARRALGGREHAGR